MSRRGSEDPAPDVYVGLLFVSVGALSIGLIALVMTLNSYGWTLQ